MRLVYAPEGALSIPSYSTVPSHRVESILITWLTARPELLRPVTQKSDALARYARHSTAS